MKDVKMMKCGHSANATDGKGSPCCAICAGLDKRAYEVDESYIQDPQRRARCTYYGKSIGSGQRYNCCECNICLSQPDKKCHCEKPSRSNLPFFSSHREKAFDEFYCGCQSWD